MDISIYLLIYIQGDYQIIYGTSISIIYNMVGMIMAVPNTYGARANFLQCCDHQDTQTE